MNSLGLQVVRGSFLRLLRCDTKLLQQSPAAKWQLFLVSFISSAERSLTVLRFIVLGLPVLENKVYSSEFTICIVKGDL